MAPPSPGVRSEPYTYNIKDKLGDHGAQPFSRKMEFLRANKKSKQKCENTIKRTDSKRSLNGSPRFPTRKRSNNVVVKNENNHNSTARINMVYPKLERKVSDTEENSDEKTEDEEARPMMQKTVKPSTGLWKKVSKNVESPKVKPKEEGKNNWKDLSSVIMEEKFKQEERKEIIGEEWRKISRIFDRWPLWHVDMLILTPSAGSCWSSSPSSP